MPAKVNLQAKGLQTSPNQLQIEDGGLIQASNVIIRRDNVIESRRGFRIYDEVASNTVDQLIVYKDRILRHFSSTLEFDTQVLNTSNESLFSTFAGTFNPVVAGLRIKSIEANGNLYITTADGIKKLSATSANEFSTAAGYIYDAGGIKALDGQGRVNYTPGSTSGFLPQDSVVAYRIFWGRRDANDNLVLGTPSSRIVIYNPLLGLLIPDYMRVLGALDDITDTTNSARIGDGDYVETLKLPANASASDLRTNLLSLATKIDNDIFYASDTGSPQPLTISTVVISSGVATVTFSAGDPSTFLEIGSNIFLAGFTGAGGVDINGGQVVTTVTSTTLTFNTTATGSVTVTGSSIKSNEYRSIAQPPVPASPATNNDLVALQTYLDSIITNLQGEPVTVITSPNQVAYIAPLDITTSATTIINFDIPEQVTSDYFYQIYRSNISQATGPVSLSDISPDDELKLVYEAFPTTAELSAGFVSIEDITDDAFRGANAYTNPATGDGLGIAGANDIPPIARDINRFKNVIFYANTKTKQRLNLNLLGVTNFKAGNVTSVSAGGPPATITTDADHGLTSGQIVYLNGTGIPAIDTKLWNVTVTTPTQFTIPVSGGAGSSTGYWTNSMISFVKSSGTTEYYFIKGAAETRTVTTDTVANTAASGYFTLYSGNDFTGYYVWYDTTGSDPDPAPANLTGIKVDISALTTAAEVAQRTADVISSSAVLDFNTAVLTAPDRVSITNTASGAATDTTLSGLANAWATTTTTQGRGENIANREVLLSTQISPAQAVDETARSLVRVVNRNSSETIYLFYLSGLADTPGKMLAEGRFLSSSQFSVVANNSDVGESFDPSITPIPNITISNSAASPTVITASGHGLVSGNQVSITFSNSTPSIDGIYTVTFLSVNTFSIPVAVSTAGTTGVITKVGSGQTSTNEEKRNRIYYSKFQQPEAVPILNFIDVGSEEKSILRIFPLRDSLFVFKEDGLFRISGETAPFNLALFDSSCNLIAADSLGLSNNVIYGWTTQGIHQVSEAGVDIISREIDIDLLKLASANYPNFKTLTWGIGYDSDNAYLVSTNSKVSDTVATITYRYNNLTNSWTIWNKSNTCGIVNPVDDRLYMGTGDVNHIEQERKSFDRTDYADREILSSISPGNYLNNGAQIVLPTVQNIKIGDVLYQDQQVTVYNYNILLKNLDNDPGVAQVPISSITTSSTPLITTTTPHNLIVGDMVTLSNTNSDPVIDGTYEVLTTPTSSSFTIAVSSPVTTAGTSGKAAFSYFETYEMVGGDNIRTKLLQLTNKLDTDPGLTLTNYTDLIDTKTGTIVLNAATNPSIISIKSNSFAPSDVNTGTDVITIASHGYLNGDQVTFTSTGTLPAPLNGTLEYYIISATMNTFQVSLSLGGAAVNLTTQGTGVHTIYLSHELAQNRVVTISGSNSVPVINGTYMITIVDKAHFSVPVDVKVSGTTGTYFTEDDDFDDLKACYNAIIGNLNTDPGAVLNTYMPIQIDTPIEALITNVNTFTNTLSLAPSINFLQGPVTIFRAIESSFTYGPQTFQDPLSLKQVREATMMFLNRAFTSAVISFASDLLPEFIDVPFNGDGNGIFGHRNFGSGFFGGGSHAAPLRTYIPRQVQRCRYILVRFTHRIAREEYKVFGISLTGEVGQSSRAYRK